MHPEQLPSEKWSGDSNLSSIESTNSKPSKIDPINYCTQRPAGNCCSLSGLGNRYQSTKSKKSKYPSRGVLNFGMGLLRMVGSVYDDLRPQCQLKNRGHVRSEGESKYPSGGVLISG